MAYSTDGETYSATVNDGLRKSMDEERYAVQVYKERADVARDDGDNVTAQLWEHIAEEERGHYNEFKDRLYAIEPMRKYKNIGGGVESVYMLKEESTSRLFPKTYGDWVNLAEDIKAKCLDDPVGRSNVNYQLQQIAGETKDVAEAKRWLLQKAAELGIN